MEVIKNFSRSLVRSRNCQARTILVQAERNQVVFSYTLLSDIGRLNIPTLGLSVAEYDPRVHFDQVKNKWIGLRTPSGQ